MSKSREFFSDNRLIRMSLATIVALVISITITLLKDESRESLITRGDFPGLLVQGIILSRGEATRLYDFEYQREIENQIWPSFKGGLYVSVYPPYHAFLMRPFALLNPLYSQALFTLIMFVALIVTIKILLKINPTLPRNPLILFTASITFPPIFFGVLGAQNTALSMLLYAITLYQVKKETRIGDFIAGVAIGAWLFKPQFALFAIALSLIMWRYWILIGTAIIGSLYYCIATNLLGPLWIIQWIKATSLFSIQNYITNGSQMSSLIATTKMILIHFGIQTDSDAFTNLSLIAHALILFLLAYVMTKILQLRLQNRLFIYDAFLSLGPIIALFSPNTLFYDLGIALIPLYLLTKSNSDATYWRALVIWTALAILVALRSTLTIPLFLVFPFYVVWRTNTDCYNLTVFKNSLYSRIAPK